MFLYLDYLKQEKNVKITFITKFYTIDILQINCKNIYYFIFILLFL